MARTDSQCGPSTDWYLDVAYGVVSTTSQRRLVGAVSGVSPSEP